MIPPASPGGFPFLGQFFFGQSHFASGEINGTPPSCLNHSSGVIPAPFLGSGKYLIDVQNHQASADPELVEGGQLLVLQIPPGKPVG